MGGSFFSRGDYPDASLETEVRVVLHSDWDINSFGSPQAVPPKKLLAASATLDLATPTLAGRQRVMRRHNPLNKTLNRAKTL